MEVTTLELTTLEIPMQCATTAQLAEVFAEHFDWKEYSVEGNAIRYRQDPEGSDCHEEFVETALDIIQDGYGGINRFMEEYDLTFCKPHTMPNGDFVLVCE